MTFMRTTKRYLSIMLTALFMLTSLASIQAQAAMVGILAMSRTAERRRCHKCRLLSRNGMLMHRSARHLRSCAKLRFLSKRSSNRWRANSLGSKAQQACAKSLDK